MVHSAAPSSESSRARIKRAARDLFASHGYERTTVRAIAGRSGLSDAAVLYHFKSKRGVLEAVLEGPTFEPLPGQDHWDPEPVIDYVLALFDHWMAHQSLFRVMVSAALVSDGPTVAFTLHIEDAFQRAIAPALRPWCGTATEETIAVIAVVLGGALLDTLAGASSPSSQRQLRNRIRRAVANILPEASTAHPSRSMPA